MGGVKCIGEHPLYTPPHTFPHLPTVHSPQTEVRAYYRIKQMHMGAKAATNPIKRAIGSALLVVPVWL